MFAAQNLIVTLMMTVADSIKFLFLFVLSVSSGPQGNRQTARLTTFPLEENGDLLLHSSHNIVASCNGFIDIHRCPPKQDLSRGLILHYKFDNASNLAQDSTENGYHGTVVGPVMQAAGVIGGGAHFGGTFSTDRVHHYIEIPNVVNTAAYTVALWITLSNPGQHNSLFMLHGGQSARSWPSSNLWIYTSHGKLAVFQAQSDLRYNDFPLPLSNTYPDLVPRMDRSPSLATSSWQHVVATFSEGRVSAYVDGQLAYEFINVQPVPVTPKSQRIYIGDCLCAQSSHPTSYEIVGILDDLRVYNRALSPVEVKQLFVETQG